ncbi:Protein FLORAL ORGAN NUMBER2 [Acorus calamus]|uniref:Protein FLORAL ORGAN NUMBER2 n=1 Tax=Acorus calamus TaxID=4465 RepID=A0AAV9DJH5_ACOCL|nr:Protein FLORAL ORGAN NUMBER2 [Acorus calamus]
MANEGCGDGFECSETVSFRGLQTRKHLRSSPLDGRDGGSNNMYGWDLRRVPSGPDPLHHNGSPKKPQTP